jgi:hypothetical protein
MLSQGSMSIPFPIVFFYNLQNRLSTIFEACVEIFLIFR